jgi:integrase
MANGKAQNGVSNFKLQVSISKPQRSRIKNQRSKVKAQSTTTKRGGLRSVASVNRELSLLRTTLHFAVQNGWLIQNPFGKVSGIISISAEVERDHVLSFDEEQRLFAACRDKRSHLKAILICALDTAMRQGEIFKMKWRDVNFEKGEIFIPQTNAKTEDSRIVGMTPRLQKELERLWKSSLQ